MWDIRIITMCSMEGRSNHNQDHFGVQNVKLKNNNNNNNNLSILKLKALTLTTYSSNIYNNFISL